MILPNLLILGAATSEPHKAEPGVGSCTDSAICDWHGAATGKQISVRRCPWTQCVGALAPCPALPRPMRHVTTVVSALDANHCQPLSGTRSTRQCRPTGRLQRPQGSSGSSGTAISGRCNHSSIMLGCSAPGRATSYSHEMVHCPDRMPFTFSCGLAGARAFSGSCARPGHARCCDCGRGCVGTRA